MARDGYRIFDSDTHVGPDAGILASYLSEAEKERLRSWEVYKSQDRSGHVTYTKGQRRYSRRLGTAEPDETPRRGSPSTESRHCSHHRNPRYRVLAILGWGGFAASCPTRP
jgi:hypothetical protein